MDPLREPSWLQLQESWLGEPFLPPWQGLQELRQEPWKGLPGPHKHAQMAGSWGWSSEPSLICLPVLPALRSQPCMPHPTIRLALHTNALSR